MKKIDNNSYEIVKIMIISHLEKHSEVSKKDLLAYVISELSKDDSLKVENIKDLLTEIKANFNSVLKEMSLEHLIPEIKTKSVKEIITLIKPQEKVENITVKKEEYKLDTKNIKPTVIESILKNCQAFPKSLKRDIISKVLTELGLTPEEDKDHKPGSKFQQLSTYVASIVMQLINEKKLSIKNDLLSIYEKEIEAPKIKTLKLENKKETVPTETKVLISKKPLPQIVEKKGFQKLKARIDSIEAKRKQQLDTLTTELKSIILEALCQTNSTSFEQLCVDLICKLYNVDFSNGIVSGGVTDHGIDGYVMVADPLGFPPKRLGIQCKCFKTKDKVVPPLTIREFLGSLYGQSFRKAFLITTGQFDEYQMSIHCVSDEGQYAFVDNFYNKQKNFSEKAKILIICINGNTLVEYLLQYKLGFIYNKKDNIIDFDPKYFN
ncbi:MAG: restriction endonuclease [Bacillales bacterium]|jgi:restriction endonuclease Mrr|nr:restriction endonuclease [Bacillales bacterium]